MVNDSRSPIPQVEEKKKLYTDHYVKKDDPARQLHHITGQPTKRILHAFYNNILQNLSILREDSRMAEDIYEPGVPNL